MNLRSTYHCISNFWSVNLTFAHIHIFDMFLELLICWSNFWFVTLSFDLFLCKHYCFLLLLNYFCTVCLVFFGCFSVRIVILFLALFVTIGFYFFTFLLFWIKVLFFLFVIFLKYLQLFFINYFSLLYLQKFFSVFFFNCFLSFFLPPFWSVKLFFNLFLYCICLHVLVLFKVMFWIQLLKT